QNVTWSSSDAAVADVDENGLVTAGAKSGTTTISAFTENGSIEAQATITVEAYWDIPALVEAEDFLDTTNEISINATYLPEGGIHLANFDFGDEVIYGVEVSETELFVMNFRIANPLDQGSFDIFIDDVKFQTLDLDQTTLVPDINQNGAYQSQFSRQIELTAGRHTVRLVTLGGAYNLNWVDFRIYDPCEVNAGLEEGDVCDDSNPNTVNDVIQADCSCVGTPGSDIFWPVPGRVEAEHWASVTSDFADDNITMPAFAADVEGGEGFFVGGLNFSEKLDYQIEVSQEDEYTIDFRYAGPQSGGEFNIYLDGVLVQEKLLLEDTDGPNPPGDFGDYSIYATQSSEPFVISAGQHTIRIEVLQGGFDLNYMDFSVFDPCADFDLNLIGTACDDGDPTTENDVYTETCECVGTPVGAFTPIPALIEAEDFAELFNAQVNPAPAGETGGDILGFIGDDTWMEYAVSVSEAASFELDLRAASPFGVGVIDVLDASGTTLVTINLTPATASFDTYNTYTSAAFDLPAGDYRLRLDVVASAFNLNWIEFRLAGGCDNPVGTACDDGDPTTENDVYTETCECVGTPVGAFTPIPALIEAEDFAELFNAQVNPAPAGETGGDILGVISDETQ
ncbi:MAG: carbohydrate-binding protein, partial [Bacteroidota bacterium]